MSVKRGNHVERTRAIALVLAGVAEEQLAAFRDDERSALLPRIALDPTRTEPAQGGQQLQ